MWEPEIKYGSTFGVEIEDIKDIETCCDIMSQENESINSIMETGD